MILNTNFTYTLLQNTVFDVADLLPPECLLVALLQANASHRLHQKTLLKITITCMHTS